jgi:hypothetical protein
MAYDAADQLTIEDGPFDSDTATNCYELFWHRTFGRTGGVGFWSA